MRNESPTQAALPPIDKVVIAIHGIGSQRRCDTIRSVARRFGMRSKEPLPVMPLGFFHTKGGDIRVSRLDAPADDPVARIGFAEVFWADIPRKVVSADDTLEETKAWASSVVSRAQVAYRSNVKNGHLTPADFDLAAGVIDEVVETVAVMENLLTVADKAGVFKFELAPLLRDYLGDVQLVTEFQDYRAQIVHRFHSVMDKIAQHFNAASGGRMPEIYIVAHSEGTVVSFLGLLQALSVPSVTDPEDPKVTLSTNWIRAVRGYMTIGSPIDKHLVLWPAMWKDLQLRSQVNDRGQVVFAGAEGQPPRLTLDAPIKWRNYYDYGDPIGFQLDTAVDFLACSRCQAFEFETSKHDFGFSRYSLPGKAHNDYWDDEQVFGHFIDDVVFAGTAPSPTPPQSSRLTGILSTALPYLLTLVLHVLAVFVLFKAVTGFLSPKDVASDLAKAQVGLQIGLLSGLLLGVTVAARLPRLVKRAGWRWHGLALSAFLAGALHCAYFIPTSLATFLGQPFAAWVAPGELGQTGVAALLLAAVVVASTGWLVRRRARVGRRTLIGLGSLAVFLMVVGRLVEADTHQPVWPVLLAGLGFLYLWWLGILLFDLAFVWHRYVRNAVAVDALRQWAHGRDASPDPADRAKPIDGDAGAGGAGLRPQK
jgi:hypothetical protein